MSVQANIQAAIENLSAKIAEVSAATGPNYSIDGQSVDRVGYLNSLIEQLKKLLEQAAAVDNFEIVSRGVG